MGYYTDFSMVLEDKVEERLRSYAESIDSYEIRELLDNGGCLTAKWYDAKDDMARFAANNPDLFFEIECAGEDGQDLWKMTATKGELLISTGFVAYNHATLYKLES